MPVSYKNIHFYSLAWHFTVSTAGGPPYRCDVLCGRQQLKCNVQGVPSQAADVQRNNGGLPWKIKGLSYMEDNYAIAALSLIIVRVGCLHVIFANNYTLLVVHFLLSKQSLHMGAERASGGTCCLPAFIVWSRYPAVQDRLQVARRQSEDAEKVTLMF